MKITREIAIEIRQEHAEKIIELLKHGLVSGVGEPVPGKFCVEAMVCYALGLPHGDDPGCVSASLRRLKIRLNDAAWSSPEARAEGLKRLALAQLGSRGVLDDQEFVRRVVEMTIRKAVPVGLRAAAPRNPRYTDALEAASVRCEQEGTRAAARHAQEIAAAYAADAATAYSARHAQEIAAAYAADAATAYSAASTAYSAATAATAAAYSAASADAAATAAAYSAASADAAATAAAYSAASAAASAAYSAAAAFAADAARDRVLAQYASWVVEILIDLQAPGCQWLSLLDEAV